MLKKFINFKIILRGNLVGFKDYKINFTKFKINQKRNQNFRTKFQNLLLCYEIMIKLLKFK